MTLTKTHLRASLGDKNFSMLVWVSYNSPPHHQLNLKRYYPYTAWIKSGHLAAINKSPYELASDQKVLSRLRESQRKITMIG